MARFTNGTVKRILSERYGLMKIVVEADGAEHAAVVFPDLTGIVEAGDEVILNVTAADLKLGSGGFHIVVWNLEQRQADIPQAGHIMKLRYTPMQVNCLAVEEKESGFADRLEETKSLAGMPVIAGTLHSQLAPAAAALKYHTGSNAKIAYIMTDRAALPMALSDMVYDLKDKGVIDTTITCGQAFGGDYEAVNIYSALTAAKAVAGADAAIVTMGVGIVGTETFLGFSGIEQGETVNAAFSLKGRPIAIPRINFKDARPRHQGLSDQTVAALGVAAIAACDVCVPRMDPEKLDAVIEKLESSGIAGKHRVQTIAADETIEALRSFGLAPTTMGRSMEEEPEFFRAAGAAGYFAAQMISARGGRREV